MKLRHADLKKAALAVLSERREMSTRHICNQVFLDKTARRYREYPNTKRMDQVRQALYALRDEGAITHPSSTTWLENEQPVEVPALA